MRINLFFSLLLSLLLSACLKGSGSASSNTVLPDTQSPVVTGLTSTVVSGNTANLTATATDNTGVTGYCFKTANIAPLASDACFQTGTQKNGVVLITGIPHFVWAKDAAGNVSPAFPAPWNTPTGACSSTGYAASNLSAKNTVCMLTDLGEIVLELDAAKAPISVANFLAYVNDGFYNGTIFHRVISTFMIQGGGYTYSNTAGYQQKTTNAAIALERTSTTGLSNLRGTIAMARTSVPNSATSQFFINVVDNHLSLDAASLPDGNGYAVFGSVISGMAVVDQIKLVPILSGTVGITDQPATPLFILWAYQLK